MAVLVNGRVVHRGSLAQCNLVARQLRSRPSIAHLVSVVEMATGSVITLG